MKLQLQSIIRELTGIPHLVVTTNQTYMRGDARHINHGFYFIHDKSWLSLAYCLDRQGGRGSLSLEHVALLTGRLKGSVNTTLRDFWPKVAIYRETYAGR